MAAPLKTDVVNRIRLLLEAGMIETRDIREALLKQTPPIRVGHNSINLHKRAWLAEQRDDHEGRKENDPGFLTSSPPEPEPHPDEHVTFEEKGDDGKLSCVTREEVRSEDDLVRVCKIDLTRWQVASMKVKAYQAAMKLETKEVRDSGGRRVIAHRPHTAQLFSVSAELRRVLPKPYLDATEALFARLESAAPRFAFPTAPDPADAPYLMVLNLFDAHIGKLCWAPETGENYDLKIAATVFRNAVDDLLRTTSGFPIGRIVFQVGQDLHHVDTLTRTTTSGTPQDAEGRYFKMIEVTEEAVLYALERCAEVAPVDAIYMGGNHGRLADWHLCRTIRGYFHRCPERISVDLSPRVRKYRRYGTNLFGFTHGHQVRDPKSLVNLMAIESPDDWAETTCREIFMGHFHTSKSVTTQQSNEFNGVMLRWGPSLSAADSWHFENGFVGNKRAAEAYLYNLDDGYVGHFVAKARSH